jgi:uncharacterized damage-inducible protein DinB
MGDRSWYTWEDAWGNGVTETGTSRRDAVIAGLEGAHAALMDAIAGLDEEAFRNRREPGAWNVAEVLAHLLDYEQLWTERARNAQARDRYVVTQRPEGERQPHLDMARRQPVPQIVHGLLAQRRTTLRMIEPLTEADFARTFTHPRLGAHDVGWIFQRIAEHQTEHAGQVHALRPALARGNA